MSSPPDFNYYEILGVTKKATTKEIRTAYRSLARVHHPDRNLKNPEAATAAFQKIQIAHETLIDKDARKVYDIRSAPPPAPSPNQRSSQYHNQRPTHRPAQRAIQSTGPRRAHVNSDPDEEIQNMFFATATGAAMFAGAGGFFSSGPSKKKIRKMRRKQEVAEESIRQALAREAHEEKEAAKQAKLEYNEGPEKEREEVKQNQEAEQEATKKLWSRSRRFVYKWGAWARRG